MKDELHQTVFQKMTNETAASPPPAARPPRRQGTYGAFMLLYLPPLVGSCLYTIFWSGNAMVEHQENLSALLDWSLLLGTLLMPFAGFFGFIILFGLPMFFTALIAERIAGREPLIPWIPFVSIITATALLFVNLHIALVSYIDRLFLPAPYYLIISAGALVTYLISTHLTWASIRRANTRIHP